MNEITGIRLSRNQTHTFVCIEAHGQWIRLIKEPINGQYDHIVNESGIRRAIRNAAEDESYQQLRASGGIVDAP